MLETALKITADIMGCSDLLQFNCGVEYSEEFGYSEGGAMRYGDAENFLGAIHENPLDTTAHGAFADYLEERGHPDASFRRAVHDSLKRRLSVPWGVVVEPVDDVDYPADWLVSATRGPLGPYTQRTEAYGGRDTVLGRSLIPEIDVGADGSHLNLGRPWRWQLPRGFAPPAYRVPGYRPSDDVYRSIEAEQRSRAAVPGADPAGPRAPHVEEITTLPDTDWRGGLVTDPSFAFPSERVYAGVDDIENMHPGLWALVEQIMRQQFEMGQQI